MAANDKLLASKTDSGEVLYTLTQWSILATALSYLLFPYFPNISVSVFGKPLFITQPLMVLSFGMAVLAAFYSPVLICRLKKLWSIRLVWAFLLLSLAVMGVSTILNLGFSTTALSRLASLVAIPLVAFLFSLLSRRFITYFFLLVAWLTIVASVLGILQFFVGAPFPAAYFGFGPRFYALGFANFSSLFGLHLALFIPAFLAFFHLGYAFRRVLWFASTFLSVVALVLTFSRGAWVALVVGMAIFLWWLWAKKRIDLKKLTTSVLLMILVAGATLLAAYYTPQTREGISQNYRQQRIEERFTADTSSLNRLDFHRAAGAMLADSPQSLLLGYGARGFYDNWNQFRGDSGEAREHVGPHSTFLEVAASGGLLAFGLFLAFLFLLYKLAISRLDKSDLIAPLLTALSIVLVDGFAHMYLYTKYMWIIAGVLLAVLVYSDED